MKQANQRTLHHHECPLQRRKKTLKRHNPAQHKIHTLYPFIMKYQLEKTRKKRTHALVTSAFNFIDQQWRLPHSKTDEQRTRPFNKREAKAALNANATQGLLTTSYKTATEFPGIIENDDRRPPENTPKCIFLQGGKLE